MTRDTPLCDADLAQAAPKLVQQPVLEVQRTCENTAQAAFWASQGASPDGRAPERLSDLDALTRRATAVARAGLRAAPASVQELLAATDGPLTIPPRRGSRSLLGAADAAVLLGAAALALEEVELGGAVLSWLATSDADTRGAHTSGSHNLGGSPRLRRALHTALNRPLKPTEQLRGTGSTTNSGSHPWPGALWHAAAVDVCSSTSSSGDATRAALSIAAALPGNEAPLKDLISRLGGLVTPGRYRAVVAELREHSGEAVFDALAQTGLDQTEVDYDRRRAIWGSDGVPLANDAWELVARAHQTAVTDRRRLHARRVLNELILGVPPALGPALLRPSSNIDAMDYVRFWLSMPNAVFSALAEAAQAALQSAGSLEPCLPSRATARPVDSRRREVVAAALGRDESLTDIARSLAVPRQVLVWELQADRLSGGDSFSIATHGRMRSRTLLTHDVVQDLYVKQGLTLQEIATHLGVSRHLVSDVLREAGQAAERGVAVDAAWLRQRHLTDGFSLKGIAAELGVSPSALRRSAARKGVQARRGSAAISLRNITLPADLHPVIPLILQRRGGLDVLRRLTVLRTSDTLTQAAARAGVGSPTLSVQVQRVETVAGLKFFTRSKPLAWTEDGKRIADDAQRVLDLLDDRGTPNAGPDPPEGPTDSSRV